MVSRKGIFRVTQRNCTFYRRLKADLQYLRRRGLLKASGELSYQGRKCTRCGAPFGRFYNTGAPCTRCRHRVCRQCRIEVRSPTDNKDVEWICNICYRIAWVILPLCYAVSFLRGLPRSPRLSLAEILSPTFPFRFCFDCLSLFLFSLRSEWVNLKSFSSNTTLIKGNIFYVVVRLSIANARNEKSIAFSSKRDNSVSWVTFSKIVNSHRSPQL